MIESLGTALANLLTVEHLAYMMLGVAVGLMVGILPGLGGIAGMALLIPFIHGMDPVSALAMLVGLVAVIPTGDTFTSVLMGIPGSSASQATVLDGFPMARRGEAARALSAAFSASLLGGVFGAVTLTGFVVIAKPVILAFSTAELFMLAILGLSVVGVLAGRSIPRGIAACGLGLLVGAIGAAPATGEMRLTLGVEYLQDGVPLVIVGLGLFAIPELVDLMRRARPIAGDARLGSGWLSGLGDTLRHWFLVIRCSALGTIIGAIPGLGGGVVDWIAYGHAVQSTRKDPQFGQGDVRGVIAPESANNALQGGALMPTLLFGIPGSGSMAVFLGGMALIGLQPGPSLVSTELHLTYTIAWTLALASVIGAAICFLLAAPIARLTLVPFHYVAPAMIMAISFAAFQARRSLTDLALLFAIGMLGLYMRRFGWARPAFLVGFVLASQSETYLYQAVQFYGWGFVTRPGVVIICILAAISIWTATRQRVSEDGAISPSAGKTKTEARPIQYPANRLPQIAFTALVLAFIAYALYDANRQSLLGGVFPGGMAAVTLPFAAYLIWALWKGPREGSANADLEQTAAYDPASVPSAWPSVAWLSSLLVMTALLGFIIALTLFMLAYLLLRARTGLLAAVIYTVLAVGFLATLGYFLVLDFPAGLLQSHYRLPWPLR